MKSKSLLYFFCLLALVLLVLLFAWRKQENVSLIQKPSPQTSQSATGISNATTAMRKANLAPDPITSQSNRLPMVNDREKTNEIRQYMESQNKPIDFFGRVVDQDGSPLANASIKGIVLHVKVIVPTAWGDEDEIVRIEKETDSMGRFEIQGISGRAVELESIQKNGYETEPVKRAWGIVEGTFEKPVIFRMWRNDIHNKLIKGEKSFDVIPDGRMYFINLTDDTISETANDSDLRMWIQYTNQVMGGQLYDWSAEIDVINGGLQQSDSYSMFSAPADGYVPSFGLQQQIKGGQRGEIGERRFYLRLKHGREYGHMTINLIAPFNDQTSGLIRLSYVINPSGSRILKP